MNDKQLNFEMKEELQVAVDIVRHQAPAGVATLINLNCNTTNICSLGTSSWRSTSFASLNLDGPPPPPPSTTTSFNTKEEVGVIVRLLRFIIIISMCLLTIIFGLFLQLL